MNEDKMLILATLELDYLYTPSLIGSQFGPRVRNHAASRGTVDCMSDSISQYPPFRDSKQYKTIRFSAALRHNPYMLMYPFLRHKYRATHMRSCIRT